MFLTLDNRLDPPVREVPNPAGEAAGSRVLGGRVPVKNALDVPGYKDVCAHRFNTRGHRPLPNTAAVLIARDGRVDLRRVCLDAAGEMLRVGETHLMQKLEHLGGTRADLAIDEHVPRLRYLADP